jgi:AcrR family transcriptional regulator
VAIAKSAVDAAVDVTEHATTEHATTEHATTEHASRLRREPQQRRSRERIHAVIEATKQLVVELDPDDVTTTLVAERAGVSVAWIYQYFEDRQAIFDTIVLDAVERIFELGQQSAEATFDAGWREVVRAGIDATARFYATEPAFVRLWTSPFRSVDMLDSNQLHDRDQAAAFYELATAAGAFRPGAATRKAIELCVRLIDRGLEFAFATDPAGDRQVLDMLTQTIIGAMEPFTPEPATSQPAASQPARGSTR